jgi:PAS domain S-box-containing protein
MDSLLVGHPWGQKGAIVAGRMGPPASTSFALLGPALFFLAAAKSRARRAVPLLGIIVIAISLLGVIGYLFKANPLFATARLTGIALQTATILLALGLALVASVPDLEPAACLCGESAASILVRRALPFLLLLPVALGSLFILGCETNFVDRGTGAAMLVLTLMLCSCLLLWWCGADVARYEKRSRRAECELQRKNAQLAAFLETAAVGLHRVGPGGTIQWANAAEMEMLGYSPPEYLGHHISEFHADEAVICDILSRLASGEKLYGYEARLKCKNGSIKHVLIDSSVLWEDGKFIHTQCFSRDITEKVRAREILEQTVAQRTASLTEALGQMEEFSYSVSHDLRAPVRAIRGFTEVALEDHGPIMPPQLHSLLVRVRSAVYRMEQLITDILEYSRVARADLKLVPISLDEFLPALIRENPELQPPRASIAIRTPLDPVLGHEPFLSQAVTNILRNAVKFVRPGDSPRIQLWTERYNGAVRLWIKDNGIGINPKYRDRLFRLFERAHESSLYEGTGVGLAIVRKSTERMGAKVGVESDGISGSSFWIELMAVTADGQS